HTADCLGEDATESGPLLDYLMFYILQHAMFDIHTDLCPRYDYSELQEALSFQENVPEEDEQLKECARRVHLSTKEYYSKKQSLQALMCDDVKNLVKFYKQKAQEINCKSNLLKAFMSTLQHVVPLLNKEIIKQLKIPCL
ncbi:hypothetical protein QZH41_008933, partial [Actinostola sp. cb2023]